ncbi:MAG TPA: hypothetical protein VK695_02450 [Steroidobacteraceae bacterium]|jgi:hypothetical protein|nr:hypothetical protein [Steroidobacteraceae bacterium]
MRPEDALSWDSNWAWSLPLVVLTVVLHVIGLGLINSGVVRTVSATRRTFFGMFVVVMGGVALLATALHALEASIWGFAYRILGALPDGRSAMLYSLSAMTTYGHTNLALAAHWQLMGAVEALNGLLLFGLTTAFLYSHLHRLWELEEERRAAARARSDAARARPPG